MWGAHYYLKRENSVLQDKVKMYRQEFDSSCGDSEHYSRCLCFRVKNIKKNESNTSEVVLESVRKLFGETNVVIPQKHVLIVLIV